MQPRERAYEGALRAGRVALARGWGHAGLARALAGRRAALPHLASWAAASRGDGPLVLVHAPSVGEALMAQAIIGAVRAARPDVQVAFTYFSPSAERIAARTGADVWSYLPWDTTRDATRLLDVLRPSAIGFVRTEIWPVLGALASARGIRTLLLNAVLAEGSSRLSAAARFFLGPAYRRLDGVGAVAADDAARFARLGVAREHVHVTGDARFDQVAARIAALDRDSPLLARLHAPGRVTLVAGSTWPADERALADALRTLPAAGRPRLIVAPHQPTEAHLAGAERTLRGAGIAVRRLADVERDAASSGADGDADVASNRADVEGDVVSGDAAVLVDRVGVLADLYAIADVAYVGGGFGTDGLHSVVEPAALGVPVLYGPRHGNAREAGELAHAGGGVVVTTDTLAGALAELVRSGQARARRGALAASFVSDRLGGAVANAALLLAALPHARPGA